MAKKVGFKKQPLKPTVARDTGYFHQQTAVNFTNDLGYFFMTKTKTNQLQRVDIRGQDLGDNATAIEYDINGQFHRVDLTTTACNYSKVRYWFVCPYCEKRRAILYLGGSGLACRECYRLAYPVENKTKSDRAIQGAFKINHRLKFEGGMDDFVFDKPKGMHWKTFNRLVAKRDDYSDIVCCNLGLWMARRFKLN